MKRRRWIQQAAVIGLGGQVTTGLLAEPGPSPRLGLPHGVEDASSSPTVSALPTAPFDDWPAERREPIHQWTKGQPVRCEGLWLDLPELVDNGNDVPLQVLADPGLNANGAFIERVTVWAPRNPNPLVLEAEFTPYLPRAALSTRIRLASSQRVLALARASDGTIFCAQRAVLVALAACIEG